MDRGFSQAEFSAASEPEVCGGSQALESDGEIGEASIAHLVFSSSFLVRSVACWPPLDVL